MKKCRKEKNNSHEGRKIIYEMVTDVSKERSIFIFGVKQENI
jgi:hypothetical protein